MFRRLYNLSLHYKEREHYHAYYSIPVLAGFLITYILLQVGNWLFPDFAVHAHGYHIHHYTYGIVILLIFGYIGLWARSLKVKYFCALAYGVGTAFIIDEAVIWFTLNPNGHYQDYDLAFYVGAIFLAMILAPLLFNTKDNGNHSTGSSA